MLAGAYSQRYKHVTDHHVNELKERHQSERSQMLARARKVQLETNRRRRAIALKRKQEAVKEEQRRQEILAKRKQQIREATERFQRANTQYQTIDSLHYDHHRDHQNTPALEEALKLVRGSPGLQRSFSYDGIAKLAINTKTSSRPNSNYSQTQNERIQEHVRQVAARTEMQSKSIRNLTNSRSLFEQQLEQHQTELHDMQRASLHHFNSAIQDELRGKAPAEEQMQHSDSLSSLDSLEAGREPLSQSDTSLLNHKLHSSDPRDDPSDNPYSTPTTFDYHRNFSPTKISNVTSSVTHRSVNSPGNIAVVQPNNAQQNSSNLGNTPSQRDHISKSGATDPRSMVSGARSIVTNDSEFLKSYISRTQNLTNQTVNYVQAPFYYDSNYASPITKDYDMNLSSGDTAESTHESVKTRLKAWATPSPIEGGYAQTISVTDNSMITNSNPAGIKATATNQTVTTVTTNVTQSRPLVSHTDNASNRASKAQPRVSDSANSRYLSGSYYTVKNYAEQHRPQSRPLSGSQSRPVVSSQSHNYAPTTKAELVLDERESDEGGEEEIEQPKERVPPSPVKSILRKTSSYSDKLGVKGSGYSASLAKQRSIQHGASTGGITANTTVRDSLEVARQYIDSRQDNAKPAKKSVRFADQLEEEEPQEEKKEEEKGEGEKRLFIPSPPTTKKPVNRRPPRPVTNRTSDAIPNNRTQSSSTGRTRSGIPVNQSNNSRKPPPAQSNPKHSESQPVIKETRTNVSPGTKFDSKGLKLDRTPTDDEINLLWDRVRDCLSRNSSIAEGEDDSGVNNPRVNDSRNSVHVPQQAENEIQPQTVHINSANSYTGRKKVTMEHLTSYSAKKSSALQRQQQQNRSNQKAGYAATQQSSYIPQNYNKEVSDSMAAFLAAETLSNRSTSASQINHTINAIESREPVFSGTRQQPKGHSALSIEEQRLLQSLEKLNERLRMTEHTLNPPTKIYVPHPPTQIPMYRNQQAINNRRFAGGQYTHATKTFR